MKKLILFMHVSLDGFIARPDGKMNWVRLSDEMFDLAYQRTLEADVALYGRGTFAIMDAYWPTAGDKPGASKHDIEHSTWYNMVKKVVVSTTLPEREDITLIHEDVHAKIAELKQGDGQNIVMFGSPTLGSDLLKAGLIDELWLLINPIILGSGNPLYPKTDTDINLELIETRSFNTGVVCLHYRTTSA